jgi:TPP-dependent 2-oxoacid decarboxylase
MEVGNMCRYGVKPVIIVLNNNGYSIERVLSGTPDEEFNNIMQIDYAKFARSFNGDIWATRVETEDDFDKALRVTQIMDKLCYIEAVVDKSDLPDIAGELFAGKQHVNKPKKPADAPKTRKTKPEPDLKISVYKNYETSVHTSLKDIES